MPIEFKIYKYEELSSILQKLKLLCRKTTGEKLKIFGSNITIVGKWNNKIISMCNINEYSPEKHFKNESKKTVPYLYNFLCDPKYRKKKVSYKMMAFVKEYCEKIYDDIINLNTEKNNNRAISFFQKNQFVKCGEFRDKYLMMTFSITRTLSPLNQ